MEIKQEIAQVQKRTETFEDIRKDAEARFRELVEAWMQRRSTFQTTLGAMQAFNSVFDRLEAARKLELSKNASKNGADFGQLGDCAKLREALKYMFMLIDGRHLVLECETTEEISGVQCKLAEARSALAAPLRNCDRPECATTKAAQDVWRKEDGGKTAYYEWILATYKEGGNDGK